MAKRPPPLRDIYPRITAFPTLLAAFRKASKGKRYRPDVLAFGANLERELFQLQHELRSFTYEQRQHQQRRSTLLSPPPEVGAFYWTVPAPDMVNSGREEQGSGSV